MTSTADSHSGEEGGSSGLPGSGRTAFLRGRFLEGGAPQVMGVLNVTPDSFSDGGRYADVEQALAAAEAMLAEGAAIIDVGGESTRPGAVDVPVAEECARVLPVIAALAERHPEALIAIDSMKPEVMREAVSAGARLINDVNALRAPEALAVAAESGAAVCLMHMRGTPRTMQQDPRYDDVVGEVRDFLAGRVEACVAAGISSERILVDPGIGFGKSLEHNLALLAHLDAFAGLGAGVLLGASRKSLFGKLLGLPVDERLAPGLAVAALAVWQGVAVIRTHDVRATVQAVATARAVRAARESRTAT